MARAVPLANTGVIREWVGMMSDISDRVRVEQAREQFIGILGHDLRSPLSAIMMGIELLDELPEPHRGVVARVGRSAQRIEAMIRDLLDFARGRLAHGIPVTPRPCDLRVVCDQIVEEIKQAHPDRAISFEPRGDLRGEWDPDRIEQAVSNLVSNAISHGTGPVRVISWEEGDEVVTTVHNRGRPVPAAVIPTLFEPFTRPAPEAGSAPPKGLGLGLYIASEIVRAHGGGIAVASSEREGTTFTMRWPRHVPPPRP
ncbi:MAG TPA: HAMP domain-containing sensor histidine kinase [Kofleriaceae bacterium]|nr:HAMP domain-containing sensor histidine kinase [Kofleriaceae bacterium]